MSVPVSVPYWLIYFTIAGNTHMNNILLQVWGGSCYLLNKFFFLCSEKSHQNKQQETWKVRAWTTYLIGVPPWVLVFISEHNWIAAAVESSGIPAILLGLTSIREKEIQRRYRRWLECLARVMIPIGIGLSLYDFGGLITFNQLLETGIAAGFLMGTYLIARSKATGYFWLAGGNICAASLMFRQEYIILAVQQIISLGFVSAAYWFQKRRQKQF